jgi:hypothetical protein
MFGPMTRCWLQEIKVTKEVPVEKIVEKIKEVPVEKIVKVEVPVEIEVMAKVFTVPSQQHFRFPHRQSTSLLTLTVSPPPIALSSSPR